MVALDQKPKLIKRKKILMTVYMLSMKVEN